MKPTNLGKKKLQAESGPEIVDIHLRLLKGVKKLCIRVIRLGIANMN